MIPPQWFEMLCRAVFGSLCVLVCAAATVGAELDTPLNRATELFTQGNYQEALSAFQEIVAEPQAESKDLIQAIQKSVECYRQLNREQEMDAVLESTVKRHAKNWRVLAAVAREISNLGHFGTIVAGEFQRGPQRGGQGRVANALGRDRVRALQVFLQAHEILSEKSVPVDLKSDDAYQLLEGFASVMWSVQTHGAWRLQELTDLAVLPEYEEGWNYGRQWIGAPVDAAGNPVFYSIPVSWEKSQNDGERWRWILQELVDWQPERHSQVSRIRAGFLRSQFGEQTLADYGWWFGRQHSETDAEQQSGTFELHTLGDQETIARLATGIRRFELPDEQNFIKLYEQVAAEQLNAQEGEGLGLWEQATTELANLFENRRQYARAAHYWKQLSERGGSQQVARDQLAQITGMWGRFEPVASQPAGMGATIEFRYRNAKRVEFVARRIEVQQLLDDVKTYLKQNPEKLDWNQLQIESLGYRLVQKEQHKYVGAEVARWSLDLDPLDNHFDRRTTVTTPLQKPGAYLVTSKVIGGNSTRIVLWLNDTAIVKKPVEGKSLYYVADAATGQPIPQCNVEFFGYWQEQLEGNRFRIETKNFAELTDESGLTTIDADETNRRHQWLAVATTPQGRFAYLGFRNIWSGDYYDQIYQQVKVFSITDRPVYRPEQKLYYKFWVAHAQYDMADESQFAAKTFQIEIRDPQNEKAYSTQLTSDLYGGLTGEWQVPEGAILGQYQINVVNHGGGTFRVEEYKKPEFEVTVEAPKSPVILGDKVNAKISARYYFGSPVTEARLHYKVLRTSHQQHWYPPSPWDWLYGAGYGWFSQEYSWYPGWSRWGCIAPYPWWFWRAPTPPELVVEQEIAIGPEGTVDIEFDTAAAKQFHPDEDHSYEIQVEVVDASRRTIVGTGQVLVARKPFQVVVWTDRGHYRMNDTVTVGTAARTLAGKPVTGKGILRLLQIVYEDGKPVETEAGKWELDLGETGQAELPIKAANPGQYRLAYELNDGNNHTEEGGHVFTIAGPTFDGAPFQFNDLEVIPDRRDYQPSEKAALQINTNQLNSVVLLFVRPANGVYQPPQLVTLKGKSTVVEVDVLPRDTPNFFVEAVTVHGGRVHSLVRELFVPPQQRVLNLEVVPNTVAYLPGQEATVVLKLSDLSGKPFLGSLALAVYDKSLEYISGGSNVIDIREYFWKWRRSHQSQGETNLEEYSSVLDEPNKPGMGLLGIFGDSVVDEIPSNKNKEWFSRDRSGDRRLMLGARFAENAPMAAAMAEGGDFAGEKLAVLDGSRSNSTGGAALVEPVIRQNFADTAFWKGTLETNAEGLAEVRFPMPENLTSWKIKAWGMGHGTQVGEGSAEVVTRKNLIVRLQSPRFFVERDEVVLSANVHNYLPSDKEVRVRLELEGNTLRGPTDLEQLVTIASNGEKRVDWRVKVIGQGTATIRMSARTDEESDAMQMSFPALVHGMLKTDSTSGVIAPEETSSEFTIAVPAERRAEQTRLEVRYTPTLAGAMVDSLPYLIDYPYGCTEQTLNRFLPAVITQQTLRKMGIDLAAIRDKRTNLNAQEIGDDPIRGTGWQRFERNPVFDDAELNTVVKAGVNRLTEMQLADGGWGWFSGYGEQSTPHTTAVVVHGLLVAQENGVAMVPGVLERGLSWLESYQTEHVRLIERYLADQQLPVKERSQQPSKSAADDLDALVYMVLAERGGDQPTSSTMGKMCDFLYRDRTKLAVSSLATFGIGLEVQKETEKLAMVLRNLRQYVRQDDENQTAWLELPASGWWYWYGSEFEAHAYFLKLLVANDPQDPVASRLVKYLLNNRKHASSWNSTRDTALVVEAFAGYLKATGEAEPDLKVEVWIDGQQRKSVAITKENLFTFENKLVLTGEELAAGRHTIAIRKQGKSPLYFNGYLSNFTLEDDIAAAGLELKIDRKYFKLTPSDKSTSVAGDRGQVVQQRTEKYVRTPLVNFAEIESGYLVEVELTVESKNDYEYIQLEDMKAAGFESVDVRSGYHGNELGAYVELRDQRVTLFVRQLPRGRHSISYRLRAEIPGQFSALPAVASAMYAPELRANSDEIKLRVKD